MDAQDLHIDPGSPEPIYRQIVGQVVRMVAAGQCPPGTRLPSVRDVAAAHAVNPMTVSKAYTQLEVQGVLERQRGKGMVVSCSAQGTHTVEERQLVLAPALRELVRQARELGLTDEQAIEALRRMMNEERKSQ